MFEAVSANVRSCKLSGSKFQTDGLATEKVKHTQPVAVPWYNEQSTTGRSQMISWLNVQDWHTVLGLVCTLYSMYVSK